VAPTWSAAPRCWTSSPTCPGRNRGPRRGPASPPRRRPGWPVGFSAIAEAALAAREDGDSLRELIGQVLAQDPRPAYRRGAEERLYGVRLRDVDVRFRAQAEGTETRLQVVEIVPA
jgi:tRNA (adenine37-N6)-methyltransferase